MERRCTAGNRGNPIESSWRLRRILDLVVAFTQETQSSRRRTSTRSSLLPQRGGSRSGRVGRPSIFPVRRIRRGRELERRIVLSQYLTAVNCSGTMPPQETGLVANSWHGKSHLEMHWWHAAHFATWGRPELLAKSVEWYRSILPSAQGTAHRQGYDGARWPKQVGPDGRESPSEIGSFLIWQQPHILYFAELLLSRRDPEPELVDRMAEVVEETARFMASFVEERAGEYHLPPPVIPAQECYDMSATVDPTFELAYWWWGLEIAQRWRERQGLGRNPEWTTMQGQLARPHRARRSLHSRRHRAFSPACRPPVSARRVGRRSPHSAHRPRGHEGDSGRCPGHLGMGCSVGAGTFPCSPWRPPDLASPKSPSTPSSCPSPRTATCATGTTPRWVTSSRSISQPTAGCWPRYL